MHCAYAWSTETQAGRMSRHDEANTYLLAERPPMEAGHCAVDHMPARRCNSLADRR